MDRYAQPQIFDTSPHSSDAADKWTHWFRTFKHFLTCIQSQNPNQLELLVNYLSTSVYKSVARFKTYEDAVHALEALYVPTKSEIHARHLLATYKQENGQTIDQYVQKLRELVVDCNYCAVSAEVRQDEAIRDSFISGLLSSHMRERLLENQTLSLTQALNMARALETAQKHSLSYLSESSSSPCAVAPQTQSVPEVANSEQLKDPSTTAMLNSKCFFADELDTREQFVRPKMPFVSFAESRAIFKRCAALATLDNHELCQAEAYYLLLLLLQHLNVSKRLPVTLL